MWYIILMIVIITTVSGLIYLSWRLSRFAFIEKLNRGRPKYRKFTGFTIVMLLFGLLSLWLNLMNAVICLLHFVVIWLFCDALSAVFHRLFKGSGKSRWTAPVAIILSLAALASGWYLNHHVWITSYVVETEKNVKDMRLVMFADSHIGTTFDSTGFAGHLQEIQKHDPDLVLIAGDFVDDGTTREEMIAACKALSNLKTTYGIYFVFGNHDKGYHNPKIRGFTGEDLLAELKRNNVKVLQDETALIDNMFYIVGRRDSSEYQRGGSRQNMQELTGKLDKDKYIIVLDHQPNDYKNQTETEVDLVLSGHTHGGQLLPLNKVGEWIGANDRTYGHERRGTTDFIVTSGLSDWAIRFKTGTKSEFVLIDLKKTLSSTE